MGGHGNGLGRRHGRSTRAALAGLVLTGAAAIGVGNASAATLYVDQDSVDPHPECTDPGAGCHSVEEALRIATDAGPGPHVIRMAVGIHRENILVRWDHPDVTIRGAGAGLTVIADGDEGGDLLDVHGEAEFHLEGLTLNGAGLDSDLRRVLSIGSARNLAGPATVQDVEIVPRRDALSPAVRVSRGGEVEIERSLVWGAAGAAGLSYTPASEPGHMTVRATASWPPRTRAVRSTPPSARPRCSARDA